MKNVIGNLRENALKVKSRQDIPFSEIHHLAKLMGVKYASKFEVIIFLSKCDTVRDFEAEYMNEKVFSKISETGKNINFVKSYLIDNADLTQTMIVVFF